MMTDEADATYGRGDLIERLRQCVSTPEKPSIAHEAANEIERLRRELAEARGLLREGADNADDFTGTDRGFPLAEWSKRARSFLTAADQPTVVAE